MSKFCLAMYTYFTLPKVIDDYSYWMGGVDIADQRISYYHSSKLF